MITTLLTISWLACVIFMIFAGSPLTEISDIVTMVFVGSIVWFIIATIISVFIPASSMGLS